MSKINLLILVVALFTIFVYFTFGFQSVLAANLARQEVGKAIEQASEVIESQNQCRSIELSVPEKLGVSSGQGYYFLMEVRAVDLGDTNALVFSVINREDYLIAVKKGKEPATMASQRRNQSAAFHIFSVDKDGLLCLDDSALLGFGLNAIPIDTLVVLKELSGGVNNIYLVPCTSASEPDCKEKLQRVACWIQDQRGSKSRCTDTPDDCTGILNDMQACPEVD